MTIYSKRYQTLLDLMAYISSNLDNKLNLKELSSVARVSKYHLGRLFQAHMGMTLGQYIRIQRLEHGMMQIVLTDKGVLDIALTSGYESHAAFCKEFKKQFGSSPREFKQKYSQERMMAMSNLKNIIPVFAGIEEFTPIKIAYVRKTGNYFRSAPEAWSALADELAKNRITLGQCERYGISHDNPHSEGMEENSMRFDACVSLQSIPDGIRLKLPVSKIDGGIYAKFIHRGALERLGESFHYIYGHWLYNENLLLRAVPPFCRYTGPKAKIPEEQIAEIHIPVRKKL